MLPANACLSVHLDHLSSWPVIGFPVLRNCPALFQQVARDLQLPAVLNSTHTQLPSLPTLAVFCYGSATHSVASTVKRTLVLARVFQIYLPRSSATLQTIRSSFRSRQQRKETIMREDDEDNTDVKTKRRNNLLNSDRHQFPSNPNLCL